MLTTRSRGTLGHQVRPIVRPSEDDQLKAVSGNVTSGTMDFELDLSDESPEPVDTHLSVATTTIPTQDSGSWAGLGPMDGGGPVATRVETSGGGGATLSKAVHAYMLGGLVPGAAGEDSGDLEPDEPRFGEEAELSMQRRHIPELRAGWRRINCDVSRFGGVLDELVAVPMSDWAFLAFRKSEGRGAGDGTFRGNCALMRRAVSLDASFPEYCHVED